MVALLGESEKDIVAVVDKCGPSDLTTSAMNPVQALTVLRAFGTLPGPALRRLSPLYGVHKGMPPFLLIHGERDSLVPLAQSKALAERLRAAAVPVELIVVKNAGHDFKVHGIEERLAERIADFLARSL